LQVDFTNQSLGDYTTCAWDFGDGGTDSNCNNPSHTYTSVGIYSVELTVQGLSGSDTLTRVDYIQVTHEAIEADFSGAPTNGIAPLRVDFTNQSFGPFTSCLWEFGDGETDSDCNNPSHTYRMGGEYTVTLTIYNDFGNDALTIPDYIKVQYGLYLPLVVRLSP
jgi:PKD repeat protein